MADVAAVGSGRGDSERPAWWRQLPLPLAVAALWAIAAVTLLAVLPGAVHAAQRFGMKLPWHTEALWGTPVWLIAVGGVAVCVVGTRLAKRWSGLVLLGTPAALAVAVLLSAYAAQAKLVWGLAN